jgi:hypothetical protein
MGMIQLINPIKHYGKATGHQYLVISTEGRNLSLIFRLLTDGWDHSFACFAPGFPNPKSKSGPADENPKSK